MGFFQPSSWCQLGSNGSGARWKFLDGMVIRFVWVGGWMTDGLFFYLVFNILLLNVVELMCFFLIYVF